ncbi:MAG: 6-hydroxycyclohex-1-ene-1-carbonyl-CoA dehydrogenase [Proteobacteria bacterium]|jgi:6-hydroxycyclohex-1-ene-1-carbonyl-CoA dehydrogenase|nr:6-hydroxycyclohex-1-ene-1-carbonyl-CoA dehydrogenase [Pseudomonadota bacterium]
MANVPSKIQCWQMVEPWSKNKETGEKKPGRLQKAAIDVPALQAGEALVEVAGCGVCHTDLGYFFDGVPTVNKPPLTLGHEISGRVVAGDAAWIGKEVIVPAVMPCNDCPICASGRGNRCLAQKMPGNSLGIYGGFASHIPVPSADLCEVKGRGDLPLERLAIVADAVTTPYQAAVRGDVKSGDTVVVIGAAGGVGSYMVQTAKAFGAKLVIGVDINAPKLEAMLGYGADHVINSRDKSVKDVRGEVTEACKKAGVPHNFGIKIFEVTGAKGGQELALNLLSFVGKLVVVGYGTTVNEYMVSRLMAFDAEMIGTWGCLPKYYPKVLEMVLNGKIQIAPFTETRPMSSIEATFDEGHAGKLEKRVVLTPDF